MLECDALYTPRAVPDAASPVLVSVVIPAYNGAATIDETLISVRAQTHAALEIIVVDDGSTDRTCDIVRRHAAEDARITLVSQPNAGVAAARNNGWHRASSDLIAFVDADDVFAPTKIEKQVAALQAGGEACGLAYVYHSRIDAQSRIIDQRPPHPAEGYVLDDLMKYNFIGNGSAVLVRRAALIKAGGFESGLRAAGAQGCEDLMFYCRVAENFTFARVPEFLLGYRDLPDNMSSNVPRMLRSYGLVMAEMAAKYPDRMPVMQGGLYFYAKWLLAEALKRGRIGQVLPILRSVRDLHPDVARKLVLRALPAIGLRAVKKCVLGTHYDSTPRAPNPPERFAIGTLPASAGPSAA